MASAAASNLSSVPSSSSSSSSPPTTSSSSVMAAAAAAGMEPVPSSPGASSLPPQPGIVASAPGSSVPSASAATLTLAATLTATATLTSAAVTTTEATAATPTPTPAFQTTTKHTSFWDEDGPGVDVWIGTIPGPFQSQGTNTASGGGETAAEQVGSSAASSSTTTTTTSTRKPAIPPEITKQTWSNLRKALEQLGINLRKQQPEKQEDGKEDDPSATTSEDGPPTKKQKRADDDASATAASAAAAEGGQPKAKPKGKREFYSVVDPYNLYYHTIRVVGDGEENEDEEDLLEIEDDAARDLKTTVGGKLTQLSISGIINGLAGKPGGIVNRKEQPLPGTDPKTIETIPTAGGASLAILKQLAHSLSQSVQAQIESDVLVTTPLRIKDMLAKDFTVQEFKNIQKRVYDTVVLGKGLSQPEEIDVPTASANSQGVHVLEKFKKCASCGCTDQSLFVLDRKNGDIICSACGTVNSESLMHEGSQFRKFEGEVDRNHHGDTQNPLYSNSHNMSTTLGGVQMNTGAGVGGFGSQRGRGLETILRNAHAYTELNISQFGKEDRRTRQGYKDKKKKDAFVQMAHVGDAINLHEAVIQRAKELYAHFREDRELLQQEKGIIAACLCIAFDQLSKVGQSLLKQKQMAISETSVNNARASRRNQLHHTKLAGKGGLLLDMDSLSKEKHQTAGGESSLANKTISSWSLEDCRSWLMEASRSIAQEWVDERKKGTRNIPEGTLEELEGKMVEHSIALCDALEAELNRVRSGAASSRGGRGRVVTPRVSDMTKLGIKWQHAHERGSGGKGGVGGSGSGTGKDPPQSRATTGRTAGQVLILKSAKKLGQVVQDTIAGGAIHKELRSLVNKQQALKRQELRNEATRQRLVQMKRKPWLQARAQID